MNKRTPVPGYRLLPSPSTKLKLKENHYDTPCSFENRKHLIEMEPVTPIWESFALNLFFLLPEIAVRPVFWDTLYFVVGTYYWQPK